MDQEVLSHPDKSIPHRSVTISWGRCHRKHYLSGRIRASWRVGTCTYPLEEPLLYRHRRRLRPGLDLELGEDGAQVMVHRTAGDGELLPDLSAGESARHQLKHLLLALGQRTHPR